MKQLLHRKSEAESAKNLANWQIYPVFFLAASPEILLFLPPVHGSAYTSSENYLFFNFCNLFTVQKSCQNIVDENSENDEELNEKNDDYD